MLDKRLALGVRVVSSPPTMSGRCAHFGGSRGSEPPVHAQPTRSESTRHTRLVSTRRVLSNHGHPVAGIFGPSSADPTDGVPSTMIPICDTLSVAMALSTFSMSLCPRLFARGP